ncbi:myeloid leukemia factor 2 isoform X1 [Myotis myotis]|uniref:myeloid leukemia factor 2 isoform X1 n=1 Tax=Myotis myotis TaxID=51298 RepID=UPI00174C4993|nr:myeloid leukemia factor 2 isoform X1 [Myotis myotis]
MFRFMRDVEPEDPMFLMDPFAIHRQHMNRMLSGGFGYSPFLSITDGNMPGTRPASRRMQAGAVSPFGMLGMSGGFMDMFGMMNDMIGNMEHMTAGGNCQTFSSSTVISYSNTGDGAPKVYQETSEMRSAPGGIRETRRTVRDSDSGLEQMSIGHHIRDRAHILQRSRNHRTGDQEERQDYINLDESCPQVVSGLCPLQVRPQHLMMNGGERPPDSGSSALWNFEGMRLQGVEAEGPKGLPAWPYRHLRTPPPDSPAAMTGEGPGPSASLLSTTLGKILHLSTSVSCFVKWAFLGTGGSGDVDSTQNAFDTVHGI